MKQLENQVAFITGGAQGIGLGIARALSAEGARLALVDIDASALGVAREHLEEMTSVVTFGLDVRDRAAYARVADDVESLLGPVSLLFNNAGIAAGVPVAAMTYEMWDLSLGVNLTGVVNGIQTFLPRMLERGVPAHIVNTASGAGLAAAGAGFLYTTAKFAVVGLSEALRMELAPFGIGVSVLCPGPVATNILRNTADQVRGGPAGPRGDDAPPRGESFLSRGKTPDEVGEMVVDAIKGDRLWIHTDDIMRRAVRARTEAILDAMPT